MAFLLASKEKGVWYGYCYDRSGPMDPDISSHRVTIGWIYDMSGWAWRRGWDESDPKRPLSICPAHVKPTDDPMKADP